MIKKNKNGQEEMVGFVIIIILTAVIFVVLLGISLRKPAASVQQESYELESFTQAMLSVTSSCVLGYEGNYQSVQDIVIACNDEKECLSGEKSCIVLKQELQNMMDASWLVGEERKIKGYQITVQLDGKMIELKEGNTTRNSLGSMQPLAENTSLAVRLYY